MSVPIPTIVHGNVRGCPRHFPQLSAAIFAATARLSDELLAQMRARLFAALSTTISATMFAVARGTDGGNIPVVHCNVGGIVRGSTRASAPGHIRGFSSHPRVGMNLNVFQLLA